MSGPSGGPRLTIADVMGKPALKQIFRWYCVSQYCPENLMFLDKVDTFWRPLFRHGDARDTDELRNSRYSAFCYLWQNFLSSDAPFEVNVSHDDRMAMKKVLDDANSAVFTEAFFDGVYSRLLSDLSRSLTAFMLQDVYVAYSVKPDEIEKLYSSLMGISGDKQRQRPLQSLSRTSESSKRGEGAGEGKPERISSAPSLALPSGLLPQARSHLDFAATPQPAAQSTEVSEDVLSKIQQALRLKDKVVLVKLQGSSPLYECQRSTDGLCIGFASITGDMCSLFDKDTILLGNVDLNEPTMSTPEMRREERRLARMPLRRSDTVPKNLSMGSPSSAPNTITNVSPRSGARTPKDPSPRANSTSESDDSRPSSVPGAASASSKTSFVKSNSDSAAAPVARSRGMSVSAQRESVIRFFRRRSSSGGSPTDFSPPQASPTNDQPIKRKNQTELFVSCADGTQHGPFDLKTMQQLWKFHVLTPMANVSETRDNFVRVSEFGDGDFAFDRQIQPKDPTFV